MQSETTVDAATTSKSDGDEPALGSGKLGPSIFDSIPQPLRKQERDQDDNELEVAEGGREAQVYQEDGAAAKPTEHRFTPRSLRPTFKNPQPKDMIRWERKQVIEHVRGRRRLNKNEKLLRTERFHSAKSPFIKTSIKKLGPLARQIAGKTVEEAMIQMRFSKKKAAQDVLKHLKYVRDQAVVAKGMGLGKEIGAGIDRPPPNDLEAKLKKEGKVLVEDKEGKRRLVTDRSAMYIDQAWVGRGKYDIGTDYRARGQANKLYLPYTSKWAHDTRATTSMLMPWNRYISCA